MLRRTDSPDRIELSMREASAAPQQSSTLAGHVAVAVAVNVHVHDDDHD
jgi:hypothetical protein